MRLIVVFAVMVLTGCVSSGSVAPAGMHAKNGSPVRVERLGTMTTLSPVKGPACHSEQVLLCRGDIGRGDCRCVFIQEAERSLERVTRRQRAFRTARIH